jgi:hypothetical protein
MANKHTDKRQDRQHTDNTPLNGEDLSLEQKQRQLEGRQPKSDQEAWIDQAHTGDLEGVTPTDKYEADLASGAFDPEQDSESLELLTEREMREGETGDPFKAAEEGQTYVPPVDPPTMPGGDYPTHVASGMGVSSLSDTYQAGSHNRPLPDADEMRARVYEALRADSSTNAYADTVVAITRGDTVILRGMVDDLLDAQNISAVSQYVEGVAEVIDELQVRTMQNGSSTTNGNPTNNT